jgi:phosphodiesterase/alkaline phosphatase D-like protein
MTLVWWTSTAGDSTVEYDHGRARQSKNVAQAGSCEIGTAGTCHTVQLTGLTPGTKYFYQLKTNGTVVLASAARSTSARS